MNMILLHAIQQAAVLQRIADIQFIETKIIIRIKSVYVNTSKILHNTSSLFSQLRYKHFQCAIIISFK